MEHAEDWIAAASRRGGAHRRGGAQRFALTLGRTLALALLVDHAAWALGDSAIRVPARRRVGFARTGVDLLGDGDGDAEDAALWRSIG